MSSRSWCFTINNYSLAQLDALEYVQCRYIIYGLEKGEKGTPHVQGYVEFGKTTKLAAAKKALGGTCHLEKRMGTRDQARDYCMKDGEWLEFGDWSSGGQGTRNDLKSLMEEIKKNVPKLDIMEAMPAIYSRNMRFVESYKAELEKQETRLFRKGVECHVLWGDAGSGKSRRVAEMTNNNVFRVNCYDAFPFDGYDGEDAILFDDFYGGIKYSWLLNIMDGHQLRVNIKGGHRYAKWTKVYFTSNESPAHWYKQGLTPALSRRLTSVTRVVAGSESSIEEVGNNGATSNNLELALDLADNISEYLADIDEKTADLSVCISSLQQFMDQL